MNIFILHPSFPAQYLNLAPYLASNPENNVFFLSKENSINAQLRGVTLALYPKPDEKADEWIKTCGPLRPAAEAVVEGQASYWLGFNALLQGYVSGRADYGLL